MTFVAASGDNGVYASHDTLCDAIKNDTINGQIPPFIPNFPASCPYVTAVGATEVAPGKSVRHVPRYSFRARLILRPMPW